ncbi:TonB-dependent receptor domain-containing protein, partial [Aggregatibacter kilianii]|uniref:TonB-dependent receptor domain-containing protein n=1 Tax=Aggregatibacter kilianii TaxID=2025884 RepID=UPI0013A669F7
GFKFDYQPLDWLLLSAGARYTHYKSVDKGLQYRLRNANREDTQIREYQIKVERLATQEELDKYYQLQTTMIYDDQGQGKLPASTTLEDKEFYRKMEYASSGYILQDPIAWQPDEFGRYSLRNYPYYDGRAYQYNDKLTQTGTNLITEETDVPVYKIDDSLPRVIRTVTAEEWARLKKAERTAHAWAPSFGITVFPTENTRFYLRYDEVKRMPSIYEDTAGYTSMELFLLTQRKPEHSKNIEVGYIHDLHGFLPSSRRADIKLNYFHN